MNPNSQQIGHYTFNLHNLLGRGSTGSVYLGKDISNDRPVAIKLIDMSKLTNEVTLYLLANEKRALSILTHPNVMRTYDIYQEHGYCYIVSEYCNQGTLSDLIRRRGRVEEDDALDIFDMVVDGYKACRDREVVHRDLKPANILMHDGVPKISDFGYCQCKGIPKPSLNYNVGSPCYMSPQALSRSLYSEKSDIWSLGVILYEMLVGKTFDVASQHIMTTLARIREKGVPYPSDISLYCRKVVDSCLRFEAARRVNVDGLIRLLEDNSDEEEEGRIVEDVGEEEEVVPVAMRQQKGGAAGVPEAMKFVLRKQKQDNKRESDMPMKQASKIYGDSLKTYQYSPYKPILLYKNSKQKQSRAQIRIVRSASLVSPKHFIQKRYYISNQNPYQYQYQQQQQQQTSNSPSEQHRSQKHMIIQRPITSSQPIMYGTSLKENLIPKQEPIMYGETIRIGNPIRIDREDIRLGLARAVSAGRANTASLEFNRGSKREEEGSTYQTIYTNALLKSQDQMNAQKAYGLNKPNEQQRVQSPNMTKDSLKGFQQPPSNIRIPHHQPLPRTVQYNQYFTQVQQPPQRYLLRPRKH